MISENSSDTGEDYLVRNDNIQEQLAGRQTLHTGNSHRQSQWPCVGGPAFQREFEISAGFR